MKDQMGIKRLRFLTMTVFIVNMTNPMVYASDSETKLEWKQLKFAQPTIESDLGPMILVGEHLLTAPFQGDFYTKTKFDAAAADSRKAFDVGKNDLSQSERIPFGEKVGVGVWTAGLMDGPRTIWFDGKRMRAIVFDPEAGPSAFVQTMVIDKIRPFPDPRGEPTRHEVAITRDKFIKGFRLRIDREIVGAGMARVPVQWPSAGSHPFLMATRIPGFPLVTVRCPKDHPGYCEVDRQCFLAGGPNLDKTELAGLGLSQKGRRIILGDAKGHRLLIYRFQSCYHVPFEREITLPKEVKEIRNVMIDSDDRIWLSTRFSDDFHNASVFVWEASAWKP